ncbi:MAG: hypothetical protein LBK58_09895 [Prevotellaceae bacterium]|jgi:hypothetical protein|nr:hypothetical protein [Prevotellaceae bacterium]
MALDNLVSVSFTEDELARIDRALTEIENIIKDKAVNLTPKQRQLYGRVAYEMEVWVDKTFSYMQQYSQLVPSYIDMEEHAKNISAHRALNPRIARLDGILQSLEDTNRLLGSDLYNNSRSYYRNLREAAKVNAVGASAKYRDLKQQFPGGRKAVND